MLSQLKNIGLSDKEAKVYIAMLELGKATAHEIADKAGVKRPTAYVAIEELQKQGLAQKKKKGSKTLFFTDSPSQLLSNINRDLKIFEQKRTELEKIFPQLLTLYNLGEEKPQVRYFEGKEGLLKMQEEFLKSKEKMIRGISSLDAVLKYFPNQKTDYSVRRIKKGIRARFIYTSSQGDIFSRSDKKGLWETKYIDLSKLKFDADISIVDDFIAISSLKGKLSGTIITHKDLANSFKNLYDFLWRLL